MASVLSRRHDVVRMSLVDALQLGPGRWDHAVVRSPHPSPFMRWAWHQAWAAAAPREDLENAFVIATLDSAGAPRALLPFRLDRLRFRRAPVTALVWAIGDTGAPDQLHVPAPCGTQLDDVVPLLEALPWDVISLRHVAEDWEGVAPLSDALRRRGLVVRRDARDSCPYLDLPSDWEAYLAQLSGTRRQTIRRKERALSRRHTVTISDYLPDRFEEGWSRLLALHGQRFAEGGVFADARLEHLLRRFTMSLAETGEIWLTTLDLDGEPAAAWYGFAWNGTVYFYQGGRDPKWESASVGLVLTAAMIRRAIERGFRRYDFLRGDEAYKRTWTSTERLNYDVAVFRRGWRGTFLRGLDALGRARGRLVDAPGDGATPAT